MIYDLFYNILNFLSVDGTRPHLGLLKLLMDYFLLYLRDQSVNQVIEKKSENFQFLENNI